jgi:hypothetical protein
MTRFGPIPASVLGAFGISLAIGTSVATFQTAHGPASVRERLDAIKRATVWTKTNISSMNLKAGPQGPNAFAPNAEVFCTFANDERGSGSTPKFHCTLDSGREIKVRYGWNNGEVYAQVAATRLFWALGFAANRMYPVRVVCRGCARDPFNDKPPSEPSAPVVFDPATIDEAVDGMTMEAQPDQGWKWNELALIDERAGGASMAERDALALLAVLIQHSSNKSINQRIVCTDGPACASPVMMIADLGKTFGRANAVNKDLVAAVDFAEWSKTPVWKSASGACIGNLHWSWSGSLRDPRIGEPGRKFLSDLLNQLTDAQLADLFTVARVTDRDHGATVADWVTAFKNKRAEIAERRCGP